MWNHPDKLNKKKKQTRKKDVSNSQDSKTFAPQNANYTSDMQAKRNTAENYSVVRFSSESRFAGGERN